MLQMTIKSSGVANCIKTTQMITSRQWCLNHFMGWVDITPETEIQKPTM